MLGSVRDSPRMATVSAGSGDKRDARLPAQTPVQTPDWMHSCYPQLMKNLLQCAPDAPYEECDKSPDTNRG